MLEDSQKVSTKARRTRWWLAPALVGTYPVLSLYFQSIDEASFAQALVCGLIVVAASVSLAFLFRLIFPDVVRASLAAVSFLTWSFTFSSYMRMGRLTLGQVWVSPLRDYFLLAIWVVLLAFVWGVLYRLRWSDNRMFLLNRFIKVACVFAIAFGLVQGASGHLHRPRHRPQSESIWASEKESLPSTWKPAPTIEPRNVYYLLFDRYANLDSLKRFFNYDNSRFYDDLEKRGFLVDRHATTSYPMTVPSMSSTLNMRYLAPHFDKLSDYVEPMEINDVGKRFVEAGYVYHYFGNQYEPLRKSSIAQWNLRISMLPWEFADSLVNLTPFRILIGRERKYQFVTNKFGQVAELAKDPAKTFAYAHFLVPHPPYAFASDGSPLSEMLQATQPEQEQYVSQLIATNRLILEMLDEILSIDPNAIIVMHADEGPYLMSGDDSLPLQDQIAKRTGILNAILIPDEAIRQQLEKPPKPVNAFRFIFKEYFGAPIELLPERTFYWQKAELNGSASPDTDIIEVRSNLNGAT
jgi:hypothetical protein